MIIDIERLGFPWQTWDPFLFCAYHQDDYPPGNAQLGPDTSLEGRDLGMDFTIKDGWRMYHGKTVPGFPQHPHRGFETITLARNGFVDHSDSLGATARFGKGDVQWMTAGSGIVHAEMFPLVNRQANNPTELFQVWLNLPAKSKLVSPYFTMLWQSHIPRRLFTAQGDVEITMVCGALPGMQAPPPPPDSWASLPHNEVAIWTLRMAPGARWSLPAASAKVNRALYLFRGDRVTIAGETLSPALAIRLQGDATIPLENGDMECEMLFLQGHPIGEAVAHHGPFVMNTRSELQQAFNDYQRTGFGGWPFEHDDPVHNRDAGRFAIHANGRREDAP
jgi:redox-sensitive bicupin YhaK (pirin superfamily)